MSKLANFLSHELTVTTWRDGKSERVVFKEGVFESREISNSEKDEHGTLVCWEPSEEFFTTPEIDLPPILQFLSTIVCLCSGLTIEIDYTNVDGNYHYTNIFHSDNGINDLIDAAVGDKEIFNNRFFINFKSGKYQMDLALTYTSNYSSTIVPYVNTGLTDSGPHITQIKTALTRELNKFFREKKWLKEKDENLSGDDTQEGLYLVFNMTAPDVGYDAQTKSRIVRLNTLPFIQAFAEEFPKWLAANEKMMKGLADKAINARKAREAARKAREAVRNKGEKNKLFNLPTKLVDAWSKNREACELYICEGHSAAGGLIAGRDAEYQAIFEIRGKILSVLKTTDERIFANQEIVNIIKALGLDIDPKTKRLIYEPKKMRYGRVVLAADGEVIAC